jgi:hypothetical protein
VHNKAKSTRTTDADSTRDFVSDGVRLGYQVIDTYLKQGQTIARQFAGTPYGAETDQGHRQEPDLRSIQLLTELMANWSDLVGIYTEALSSAPEFIRPSGQSQAHPAGAASKATPSSTVQLAYELTSRRPALVDVEFFPGRETLDLAAHGLRCLDSSVSEIAVMFDRQLDRQRTVISIQVSDDQPPGLYTGTLIDSHDGSAVGIVSLRIR